MTIGTKALRRGLVRGLVVICAFGVVSVADAAAKTVTVGQLFTPNIDSCNTATIGITGLQTGVASGTSYTVPKAGVITSWSWYDGANTVPGLKLKAGRSTAVFNDYKIIGEATAGTQTPNAVQTYHADIPVRAGDLIGIYQDGGSCLSATGNSMDTDVEAVGDVPPGATATFSPYDIGVKFPVSAKVALDCVVPKLKGETLRTAKRALKAASCTLGKVRPKGQRKGRVKSQKPAAGKTLAPGAKVNVRLG